MKLGDTLKPIGGERVLPLNFSIFKDVLYIVDYKLCRFKNDMTVAAVLEIMNASEVRNFDYMMRRRSIALIVANSESPYTGVASSALKQVRKNKVPKLGKKPYVVTTRFPHELAEKVQALDFPRNGDRSMNAWILRLIDEDLQT